MTRRGTPEERSYRATLTPDLAASLREWRHRRGLPLRAVAARARISEGYLSRLERAQRAPSVAVAWELVAVLDLDDAEQGRLLAQAQLAGRSSVWAESRRAAGRRVARGL